MVVRIKLIMMKSTTRTSSLLWSSNTNVNSALTLALFSLFYSFNAMQCISLDIFVYLLQLFKLVDVFHSYTTEYIRGSRIF